MKTLIVLALAVSGRDALAVTKFYPCPPRISTQQALAGKLAGFAEWVDATQANLAVKADFYDGEPKDGALLAPDNADSGKDPVWTFQTDPKPVHSIWQVCRYQDTFVTLARELPAGVKSCRIRRGRGAAHPQLMQISCELLADVR